MHSSIALGYLEVNTVQLIRRLLDDPTCQEFQHFKELLGIIRDKMLVVHPSRPATHDGTNDLSLQRSQSGSGLERRKSSGQVADSLASMSVFENDVVDVSRQNTLDLNAPSTETRFIRSIPDILQASTSTPHSPIR